MRGRLDLDSVRDRVEQKCGTNDYCSRTVMLSPAPRASMTVKRTKPGPSGVKKMVRRSPRCATGAPFTSTVSGPRPPATFKAIGSVPPANSRFAPFGGNMMRGDVPVCTKAELKRRKGGGSWAVLATSPPAGAGGELPPPGFSFCISARVDLP
jgi:hypothetical protein